MEGVEPQSETVWRQAERYLVPRIAFVNKMDRTGANFEAAVKSMRDRLAANAVPLQIPLGSEDQFKGVIDLIRMRAYVFLEETLGAKFDDTEIPADYLEAAKKAREFMIEKVSEHDDHLMHKFIEGHTPTEEEIKAAIRKATVSLKMTPVLCGSSLKNKGVQMLLDGAVDYLPSPKDIPAIKGTDPKTGAELERHPTEDEPLAGLGFKIAQDPFAGGGKLTYVRIYSGVLKSGSYIYNSTRNSKERVGRLLLMHANKREEIEEGGAGNIVAIIGLRNVKTGDTFCDESSPIVLESLFIPEPVLSLSIEPKTKADRDKLSTVLQRMGEEDPTFRVKSNEETGQTIISGMGELHLEIIVDRMKREFNVEASVGKPQVAYKETIQRKAKGEGKYIRQTGGRGQYGHCYLEVEPLPRTTGIEFVNKVVGGAIPREYVPAVEDGVRDACLNGVLAGYPVTDIRITCYDGSFHDVDSSEIAFQIAGSMGFKEAVKQASPVLLEPIMNLEVVVPEEFMGDVIGDLNSRRCIIQEVGTRGNLKSVRGLVPLADMFGYATAVRSLSQGRATFTMEPHSYSEVPKQIAEKIIAS